MEFDKIKSVEQIYIVLLFLTPGLLIVYFRAMFVTGRRPKTSEYVIEYIVLSTAYLAIALPALEIIGASQRSIWLRALLWLLLLGALPAAIGIFLGAGSQLGWWRKLFGIARLSVVSPYPTGWDWIFARLKEPAFLLVTLDNGATVAGYFGFLSLASSEPSERDIYIEEIYDIESDGTWTRRPEKQGILISGKVVKHIEIWRATPGEPENV